MPRRYLTAAVAAACMSGPGMFGGPTAHAAIILHQDFSAGDPVSQYVSATPDIGQFTDIAGTTATPPATGSTSVSAASSSLVFTRTGGQGRFTRSDDFAGGATLFSAEFLLGVTGTGSATSGAVLRIGTGYLDDGSIPLNANTYNRLAFNIPASGNSFQIRDIGAGQNSASFFGPQVVRWYSNNSGSPASYLDPAGGTTILGDDLWDVWVGTTLVFAGRDVLTPTQAINDVKFIWNSGTGTMSFGSITFRNDLDLITPQQPDAVIPEPGTTGLLGLTLVALAAHRRFRDRRRARGRRA